MKPTRLGGIATSNFAGAITYASITCEWQRTSIECYAGSETVRFTAAERNVVESCLPKGVRDDCA